MTSPTHLLSLAALTVLELAPPAMVRCADAAGYRHIGLRVIPATDHEPRHDWREGSANLREVVAALAGTGVRVLDIEILRLTATVDIAALRRALELGARLGARFALVAGNDPEESRLTGHLAALCDLGAPLGIAMALEPMPWTDVRTFPQALRVVEATGRDNACVLLDPIHFDRAGDDVAELARAPGHRLRYAQLCDAPAQRPVDRETLLHQARAERLMPGDGGLDLAGMLRALPAGLPLSLEVPMQSLAQTVPAVERARRLRERTERLLASLDRTTMEPT